LCKAVWVCVCACVCVCVCVFPLQNKRLLFGCYHCLSNPPVQCLGFRLIKRSAKDLSFNQWPVCYMKSQPAGVVVGMWVCVCVCVCVCLSVCMCVCVCVVSNVKNENDREPEGGVVGRFMRTSGKQG